MTENNNEFFNTKNGKEHNGRKGSSFTPLDQLVSPVGPQMTLPFTSVDSNGQQAGNQEHLHLFGESQFHNNLGPVYAVPTYPWPHGNGQGMGSSQPQPHGPNPNMVSGHWQQWGNQFCPVVFKPCYCGNHLFRSYYYY